MPEQGCGFIGENAKMNLAIIPARGGSKRIPRKNIKAFCGKPMIVYATEAAIRSKLFDHIVVSTDDLEIRATALKAGAEAPFLRPVELADDYTPTVPVVFHAIRECRLLGWNPINVCCIYPCNPFLSSSSLSLGYTLLKDYPDKYIFPVTEFASPIQLAIRRDASGLSRPFFPENELKRTQDLEQAYHDAGQFYWARAETWESNLKIHVNSATLMIPRSRVVDIDTGEDWSLAEKLFKNYSYG
jgi:pseudaminic acid cytidylyltransferase